MKGMQKIVFMFVLAGLAFLTSGCFTGDVSLKIREDGSSTIKTRLLGVEFISQAILESKDSLTKNNPNATIKEITQGDQKGFEVTSEYKDMRELSEKGGDLFKKIPGKAEGIRVDSNWFYDAYDFDLCVAPDGEKASNEGDAESKAMMQGFLQQIKYDFSLSLPVAPESHNADSIKNDGTLYWNLAPTLTEGKEKKIQMRYRIWNQSHIALTAGAGVLFLILAISCFYLSRKNGSNALRILAAVFAILMLAIAAFGFYGAKADPSFKSVDTLATASTQTAKN